MSAYAPNIFSVLLGSACQTSLPALRPEADGLRRAREGDWCDCRPRPDLVKRVLVFPCGSEIGLEIHRALQYSTHFELVGASSVASNHGKYVFKNYVEGVPYVDDPGFLDALNALIDEQAIDFVLPAHDSVVLELARHAERLHCTVVGSPLDTCVICRRKSLTYQAFHGKLPVPHVFSPDETVPFPVFLKPDAGQGSKGVHVARSREEIAFYRALDPSLIILEYLPGDEYTIDCFTDRHRALRFVGARRRVRRVNGISVDTVAEGGDVFRELAEIVNSTLLFRGAWFFQLKRRSSGEPVLMEIAPRISGAMGFYRNLGVNYALLSLFDRMGLDVDVYCSQYEMHMDRALFSRFHLGIDYQHVYIDLDDTIICRGTLNTLVVAFLCQCRNEGRKVHLLSRHATDPAATVRAHGIEGLFDTITRVADGQCKSELIRHREAIFIDDSYAERRRVQQAVGIPTFEVGSIESLLDWRR